MGCSGLTVSVWPGPSRQAHELHTNSFQESLPVVVVVADGRVREYRLDCWMMDVEGSAA